MALNRLTGRCGHLWEARYFSTPIETGDTRRVLATLRYFHANPKAAGVRKGFHDPYSNDGHDEGLAGEFGALEFRNQREQAVRAAVTVCLRRSRRACKSMAPLQRGRGDQRRAEGARYRSARWTSGRSGSGNFDAVPQLAAEAEGGGSTEEGQGAWDGRRRWPLDRSECNGARSLCVKQ